MRSWFVAWAGPLILMLPGFVQAAEPASKPQPSAPKTVRLLDPSFVPIEDDPKLPRVLILGDSISIGYTIAVRELLRDKANVHRPPANCGNTTQGLAHLDQWLGEGKWDVIHFNFGLHDLKYLDAEGRYVGPPKGKQVTPLPQYEKNLRELVARLKKTEAKLIWASTTPVPDGSAGRVAGEEIAYNRVAARIMDENGIVIDDLYGVMEKNLELYQRVSNVHFTTAGNRALARTVASSIEAALSAKQPISQVPVSQPQNGSANQLKLGEQADGPE
jgi:acyl-CoA thioesterase-1